MKNTTVFLTTILLVMVFVAKTKEATIIGNDKEEVPCQEIQIKCTQAHNGNYIIKNETEYQTLLKERSPHPDCPGYELPPIDFTKYSLLGIVTSTGGCAPPTIEHSVYYVSCQNSYLFELKFKQNGLCERKFEITIWCLIPKIVNNTNVKFKTTETQ